MNIAIEERPIPVDKLLDDMKYPLKEIRDGISNLIENLNFGIEEGTFLYTLILFVVVLLSVAILDFIFRFIFVRLLPKLLRKIPALENSGKAAKNISSKIVRVIAISLLISLLPIVWPRPNSFWRVIITVVCNVWIVIVVTQLIANIFSGLRSSMLSSVKYRHSPFVNLFQVFKGITYFIATLVIISIIFSLNMTTIATSLTALSAVLMLVFKDSILGFVASIQLSNNDMVRVGDWITVPSQGVDGDVIDISLATVKVRSFDMTVYTVPPYTLVSTSVQNWRPMQEAGGRRVKRALYIDMKSIRYADNELLERVKNAPELRDYIVKAVDEINKDNVEKGRADSFSRRGLTNIGIFRRYIVEYLKNHPEVNDRNFTCMVRQLQPTGTGLPLELYFFTNTTVWVDYERIQSDIFDHLMAVIGVFDLKIFQDINGNSILPIPVLPEESPRELNESQEEGDEQ
ncbi:mechanosensitive ion channel [Porphyromonadaceae bacterium W3.11]|nr:mechanosensitive ion channel [Porphyromonadaceae bacterium W3.11]